MNIELLIEALQKVLSEKHNAKVEIKWTKKK